MSSNDIPRVPADHREIGLAAGLPTSTPTPFISYGPLILPAPQRVIDLQLKVSFPATGSNLPIILLSHGHGHSKHLSSLNGYGPLTNYWASHGFVVIQPTHLTSNSLNVPIDPAKGPQNWKTRAEDMTFIIDHLDTIESTVPLLQGRLDHSRIALAGHSFGGHTGSMLLGMTTREEDGTLISQHEPRIKAGVLLAATGNGDVTDRAAKNFPFMKHSDHSTMTTPALVVVGDADGLEYLTSRGYTWHADAYTLSPGPKGLLTLYGGKHGLGGIPGFDANEVDDESIERVGAVQRLSSAYLKSQLYEGDESWTEAVKKLEGIDGIGKVESK